MTSLINGKDVVKALNELRTPASLTKIVDHLSTTTESNKPALLEEVKLLLEAGIGFGCIVKEDNKYRTSETTAIDDLPSGQENRTEIKDDEKNTAPERHELQNIKSVNELHTSSGSVEISKGKKKSGKIRRASSISRQHAFNSSDDDDYYELNDLGDCCGSRYSRKRQSRSRSVKRSKSNSRPRSRRRRRA